MKVLVAIGGNYCVPENGEGPKTEFDWLDPGELVNCGINATYMAKTFSGCSSLRHATRAIVTEMGDQLLWLRVCPAADNIRKIAGDRWLAEAVNFERWVHEAETLYRQAERYPVGTVVCRTADGLDIKEIEDTE